MAKAERFNFIVIYLSIQVTLLPPAFKNTSINPNLKQIVRISLKKTYPI